MPRKIEVVDYNPDWAFRFALEKRGLQQLLGSLAIRIEHIGSTSVPGLCAKPVLDIAIEVSDLTVLDSRREQFVKLGYLPKGENGIEGRRYFQKGGDQRSHHIHAFLSGNEHLLNHLVFKAYLIAHPDIALQYGDVKKNAASHCDHDSRVYMAMKNTFIQTHLELARLWYKTQTDK